MRDKIVIGELEKQRELLRSHTSSFESMDIRVKELEGELRQCMKYIGAVYEYLQIRPQRTFVQDFSRLPQEETPTMEVIKATKIKKSTPPVQE